MTTPFDAILASAAGTDRNPDSIQAMYALRVARLRAAGAVLPCLLLAAVATSCSKQPSGDEASAATAPASAQADAQPARQAPQQSEANPTITAFPSPSDACHRTENEDLGETWPPIPSCTKVLMEKYGDYIRFTTQPPTIRGSGDESGKSAKDYLTIRAGNGSTLTYRYMSVEGSEEGENDYAFDPVPYVVYEPLKMLLVSVVSYGEEVTYDLINLDTGKKTELGSIGLPLEFSPDGKRFFVPDAEFGVELPLSLSVYRLDSGVVVKEGTIKSTAWFPFDARWDGAGRIAFTGATEANVHWDDEGNGTSTGPHLTYGLEGGKWQPLPAPADKR